MTEEELFDKTLDVIANEVKRLFLIGAERIVLTRDGEAIFCEPDEFVECGSQ